MMNEDKAPNNTGHYAGLPRLLYIVRWSQHLLSILAEVLILLSFAMSGMDVSLGGSMASILLLKILWAAMFALGIDTAFVLSWVRVRQCVTNRRWLALIWNVLLAISMSAILFQPVAIQLLQQSLDMDFTKAVDSLSINIITLTYARSAVAVLLGAILAITNVESEMTEQATSTGPKRKIVLLERLLNQVAPIVGEETLLTSVTVNEEQPALHVEAPAELSDIADQITVPLPVVRAPAQSELPRYDTPEQRALRMREVDFAGLDSRERIAKVLELFPNLSDRELGKLSNLSAATAKKHREALKHAQESGEI